MIDEELVSRRRLGQTDLKVKAAQIGTANPTKNKSLGTFDYAHLKAPLPRGHTNSELFGNAMPDSYFLMVSTRETRRKARPVMSIRIAQLMHALNRGEAPMAT